MTFALTPQASVLNGRVRTTDASDSSYGTLVDNYGEGDFTLELGFSVSSVKGRACVLLAHWHTQTRAHAENFISISVLPNKHVQVLMAKSAESLDWSEAVSARPITLNTDYTLVLERVGAEVCLYLNGALVSFFDFAGPTFFKDHTLLGYHTGEPTGGSRQVWGLRIAKDSMYRGNVTQARRFPEVPVQIELVQDPIWRQYRFVGNSLVDEVTETSLVLTGNAKVLNDTLSVVTPSAASFGAFNQVVFGTEDFYITASFKNPTPAASVLHNPIVTQWSIPKGKAWLISQAGPANLDVLKNRACFYYGIEGNTATNRLIGPILTYNEEHTIEVERVNGIISMYVDGVFADSRDCAQPNQEMAYSTGRIFGYDTTSTTEVGYGTRWNIRIVKGKRQITGSSRAPLLEYKRPVYSAEDAAAVVMQLGMRQGSPVCEVTDTPITLAGTTTVGKNGRLSIASTSASYALIPLRKWGAGDFTIEASFTVDSLAAGGCIIIGQWYNTGETNGNNRWGVYLHPDKTLTMGVANTPDAPSGGNNSTPKSRPILFGVEYHIVVERVDGIMTLYINGVPGIPVASVNPLLGTSGFFCRFKATKLTDTFGGTVHNVRIMDKAMYRGAVKQLPAFPSADRYPVRTDRAVALQYTNLKEDSLVSDTGDYPLTLTGDAKVVDGRLVTGTGNFSAPCPTFGQGDFTIEAKITFLVPSGEVPWMVILSQYDGVVGSALSSWNLAVNSSTKQVALILAPSSWTAACSFVYGVEYHFVVERIASTVTVYQDGIPILTATYGAAIKGTSLPVSASSYSTSTYPSQRIIRDIRVASRALYNGAIHKNFKQPVRGTPIMEFVRHKQLAPGISTQGTRTVAGLGVSLTNKDASLLAPHSTAFAIGTGDFRFELTFKWYEALTNWSTWVIPLLTWGSFASATEPSNFNMYLDSSGGLTLITGNVSQPTDGSIKGTPLVSGGTYVLEIERVAGIVTYTLNSEVQGRGSFLGDIKANVVSPVRIGTRYGGGDGSIYWSNRMEVEHCWFGRPAVI